MRIVGSSNSNRMLCWGARGASITEVEGEPLRGQIFKVFTLRAERMVRIDDYRGRREALTAARVAENMDGR